MPSDPAPAAIQNPKSKIRNQPPSPPELFQIVIECAGETQQRDLFDRLRREGLKLRLLVL
jgi:N6-adenosine-specific RNA methylase IME4